MYCGGAGSNCGSPAWAWGANKRSPALWCISARLRAASRDGVRPALPAVPAVCHESLGSTDGLSSLIRGDFDRGPGDELARRRCRDSPLGSRASPVIGSMTRRRDRMAQRAAQAHTARKPTSRAKHRPRARCSSDRLTAQDLSQNGYGSRSDPHTVHTQREQVCQTQNRTVRRPCGLFACAEHLD